MHKHIREAHAKTKVAILLSSSLTSTLIFTPIPSVIFISPIIIVASISLIPIASLILLAFSVILDNEDTYFKSCESSNSESSDSKSSEFSKSNKISEISETSETNKILSISNSIFDSISNSISDFIFTSISNSNTIATSVYNNEDTPKPPKVALTTPTIYPTVMPIIYILPAKELIT